LCDEKVFHYKNALNNDMSDYNKPIKEE
jgi:hypothetical protein